MNVLFNGLEVGAAFFGPLRSIFLQLSDPSVSPIQLYLLSFRAPDDFPVAAAGPNFSSWMRALCEAELQG